MSYKTLISTGDAHKNLNHRQWLFIDCRYYLENPVQGQYEYSLSHLPGALYADLANDLSSPVEPGVTGRHPLPDVEKLCKLFSKWGIGEGVQVVVYDQGPGMVAARLWWMLHWLGHDKVAVMDGGWNKWRAEAKPVTTEMPITTLQPFKAKVHRELVVDVEDVMAGINNGNIKLLDARAADRYRGQNETLDPIAGHIPGALSAPFGNNVGADGCFRSAPELHELYNTLIGESNASNAIVYCGSGVTAAHTILTLMHLGFGMARLYPGSWSHWITDKRRPIELSRN